MFAPLAVATWSPPPRATYDTAFPLIQEGRLTDKGDQSGMRAVNKQFMDLINGSKQFVIPVFQRDYSWGTPQCEQLWNDIIRAGNNQADSGHFLGSIVYVGTEIASATFSKWLVIDGQQRLTTLILLLTALRDHIQASGWVGGEDSPTVGKLDDYLINRNESLDRKYKIALRRFDNSTLQDLIDGKDIDEGTCSERVLDTYEWFRDKLEETDFDCLYLGIARLSIVDVTLDRGIDNPQLVFESLNSTGLDLSQSDLIRNFLLMELVEMEQTRLYNTYWQPIETLFRRTNRRLDWFLRDYMALAMKSTVQTRIDRIYDAFKDFKDGSAHDSLETLLQEMHRFAGYYVMSLSAVPGESKELLEAKRYVRSLTTTHAILGMKLYQCYKRENSPLSEAGFIQALGLIESFIVRRGVLGWQSRDYWSIFAGVARDIDINDPLESLKVALARQRYHFPTTEQFLREIKNVELYWQRDLCWHILTRLENDRQREPSPTEEYSIEHIMPQNIEDVSEWKDMLGEDWEEIHEEWLHRLGNLTLTAYNSALSNRPFEQKKTIEGGFEQSAARLNQYVRKQSTWTDEQMRNRGNELALRAANIWQYHGADEKRLREAVISDLRTRATNRSIDSLTISSSVRNLLNTALVQVRELGDIIEVIERGSVCCYGPDFFVELLPAKGYIRIILPTDIDEVDIDDCYNVYDTTSWKFVPNRAHTECRMLIDAYDEEQIASAIPVIREAFGAMNA